MNKPDVGGLPAFLTPFSSLFSDFMFDILGF
jgi:hypothetical protein